MSSPQIERKLAAIMFTDIEEHNMNSRDSEEYYGFSLNINDIDMLIDDIVNIF